MMRNLFFNEKVDYVSWDFLIPLVDYILTEVQGCIVEIGTGYTSEILWKLALKHNRQIFHCDINPLESRDNINKEFLDEKNLTVCSSNDFFEKISLPKIAIGFIDGDHQYEQVRKDFNNLYPEMSDFGCIFIHDTFPKNESSLLKWRCGDSYRFRQEIEKEFLGYCFTFTHSMMSAGLTMVKKKPLNLPFYRG